MHRPIEQASVLRPETGRGPAGLARDRSPGRSTSPHPRLLRSGTDRGPGLRAAFAFLLILLLALAVPGQAGPITTIAGGGATYGDGGQATQAQLSQPQGIAVDASGNIYFADFDAFVVRRVDAATGVITTIAGINGQLDFFGGDGDGGPATSATLGTPIGVSLDAVGNVYLADQLNNRVRKVDAGTGIINTVAGDGSSLYGGDGGLATSASIAGPNGVAHDASGNMYIADTLNSRIRKVSASSGIITTIAGNGVASSGGDDGPATSASFASPRRVTVDAAGNVYVLDVGTTARVRRIASNGIIGTVAGGGVSDGTSGTPTGANLGAAADVDVDNNGRLLIAGRLRVWKVDLFANTIVSVAGRPLWLFGRRWRRDARPVRRPRRHHRRQRRHLLVTDAVNNRVRKVTPSAPPPPPPPTFDGNITLTTSQTTLDNLSSFTGSLQLVNVPGVTSLSLPNLGAVTVDFTVSGNPGLAVVSTPVLSTVGGSYTVSNNDVLESVSVPNVTVGGDLIVTANTVATVISVGSVDTAGDLTVIDNPSATVSIGGGTVGGDLTVETTGSTVNFSTTTASGNVTLTGTGTTTLSATTGGLDTTVTLVNTEAAMTVYLPSGSTTGAVGFTVTHQDPATLPVQPGVDFTANPVNVDPVSAYSFNFAIPTLNSDAMLVFDINVAGLDAASQTAFLAALASGSVTLAVKNDTAGSQYQTFAVCSGNAVPTAGGCVSVEKFDASGNPTAGIPAWVRFTGVVGHFSTYAVVIVTPLPPLDTLPPTSSAVVTPTPNGLGWNNANVSVNLSATDNAGGSGVKEIIYSATGAQPIASTTVPGASAVIPITREGTTTITYRARDFAGNLEAARRVTVKLDKTPPVVGAVALPALLRPADHRLVNIKVTVGVADLLSGANGFTLVSVTSNEPDSGTGGGDLPGDIVGWTTGTADTQGQLRAERSPTGRGRAYKFVYRAVDKAGNVSVLTLPSFVVVPK